MRRTLLGKSKKKRFALLLVVALAALATLAAAGHTDDEDQGWWDPWGGQHGGHFHHGVKHKKHPHHDDHGHHKHHGHGHHHHALFSPVPVVVFPDDGPEVQNNESEVNVDANVTNVVDFSNANVSGAKSHGHHPDCHFWYGQGCHNGHAHHGSIGPLIDLNVNQSGKINVNVGVHQDNDD